VTSRPLLAKGSGPVRLVVRKKAYVLGGWFGGLRGALELEWRLDQESNIDVTIVNRDNFFVFTPMLHEAASDLEC
jgi:NADH:ubiquinone reductase (H+-translocating)